MNAGQPARRGRAPPRYRPFSATRKPSTWKIAGRRTTAVAIPSATSPTARALDARRRRGRSAGPATTSGERDREGERQPRERVAFRGDPLRLARAHAPTTRSSGRQQHGLGEQHGPGHEQRRRLAAARADRVARRASSDCSATSAIATDRRRTTTTPSALITSAQVMAPVTRHPRRTSSPARAGKPRRPRRRRAGTRRIAHLRLRRLNERQQRRTTPAGTRPGPPPGLRTDQGAG